MIWCLLFLCFFSSTNLVEATCTKISDCACRLPDGRIVNLTEIANKNETEPAPFKVTDTKTNSGVYYYNPCLPFTERSTGATEKCDPSHDVAVCQENANSMYNAGRQSTATFTLSSSNDVIVNYTSTTADDGSYTRKTGVILNCDETDEEGTLEFTDSKPNKAASVTAYVLLSFPLSIVICVFVFVTLSNESGPSGGGGSGGGGLSAGSILLIVFFCLLFVYFVGGIIFLKFARGAEGVDMIPNHSFWGMLPGLIKDGVVFAIDKCRGTDNNSHYEKI